MTILHSCLPPPGSVIADGLGGAVDYSDCYSVAIRPPPSATVDDLTLMFFSSLPSWILSLLKFRDVLVKPLGLRTADGAPPPPAPEPAAARYDVGDTIGFFQVHERNEHEIVMAEDDRHLYFRTSVMIGPTEGPEVMLHSSTLVTYHGLLGRTYFFFVKPFHRLIIRSLLKRLRSRLREDGASTSSHTPTVPTPTPG